MTVQMRKNLAEYERRALQLKFRGFGAPSALSASPTPRARLGSGARRERHLAPFGASGSVSDDDVICFGLDRRLASVYVAPITVECCPCLTTKNRYLFVLRISDVCKPYPSRGMCRWLTPAERFSLQGFSPLLVEHFGNEGLAVQASGNAYPVPLVLAA
eukprot:570795-Pyramimonas_sp.AAC.1